jgi:hypothetical protein
MLSLTKFMVKNESEVPVSTNAHSPDGADDYEQAAASSAAVTSISKKNLPSIYISFILRVLSRLVIKILAPARSRDKPEYR